MAEDNFASPILAGLLLIVIFGGMRAFYGCWPWEYPKTWYRTAKEIAHLKALIGKSRPSDRLPEPTDTEESPAMPNPIADALREKIAEALSSERPSNGDALDADEENEYPREKRKSGKRA